MFPLLAALAIGADPSGSAVAVKPIEFGRMPVRQAERLGGKRAIYHVYVQGPVGKAVSQCRCQMADKEVIGIPAIGAINFSEEQRIDREMVVEGTLRWKRFDDDVVIYVLQNAVRLIR